VIVSEVFGPTVQGEGPSMGRRCAFVRLGHCNLRCRWCDTPYTWDWTGLTGKAYVARDELVAAAPEVVADRVESMGVDMVVVSGGEPLLQQPEVIRLLRCFPSWWRVEVETNGTRVPAPALTVRAHFNVSPKLAHSGDPEHRRIIPEALVALQRTGRAVWKFVAAGPANLAEIAGVVDRYGLHPVYVMPLGVNRADVGERLASMADAVVARGWNLTTRLHVDAWGGKRGT
jgi:7-carboxy-7-deazaguanine synthase